MDKQELPVDKKEQKIDVTAPAPQQAATAAPMPAPAQAAGKEFSPFGEKVHDGVVTGVVDYGLNSTFGVGTTYLLERTKRGQEWVGKPAVNGLKKVLSPLLKAPASQELGALWAFRFLSIMVGGTLIIPIMTYLEKGKTKINIINWFDKLRYGKEKVDNDPKFAEAYRRIENEPHKDFWTGMAARFIAIAPLITAATFIPKTLTKHVYDRIGNGLKWTEHKVLRKPAKIKWLDSAVDTSKLENKDFLYRIIGFDFGLTPVYAVLHKLSFDSLAAWRVKKGPDETTPVLNDSGRDFSQTRAASDMEAVNAALSLEKKYKKKIILPPAESHAADLVKARETDYSLAP